VISSNDSDDVKAHKIQTIINNRKELENLKESKAEEIVTYLDLFGGQISLLEIMNMPISLLRQLKAAKIKEKELMSKSRAKASKSLTPAYVSAPNSTAGKNNPSAKRK
jgi:hypothetical protein